ncbi:MAG TPA: DUF6348 family protein [Cyclobacteriaceae bacterium]|nr:DUF6348 family protein [Cyclobacteriaceae bacterium]
MPAPRIVNTNLAAILNAHGVRTHLDHEFVHTNLAEQLKFNATATYHEVNNYINSRLDVTVQTSYGEEIIECFGDFGATVYDATDKNFQTFSLSSLHPILAAFGSADHETLNQIQVEKWNINEKIWQAYIGSLVPKSNGQRENITPPAEFFQAIERTIRSQNLTGRMHWFRSYYCQWQGDITEKEFLINNEPQDAASIFANLPAIPGITFYSCRNFILLKATHSF